MINWLESRVVKMLLMRYFLLTACFLIYCFPASGQKHLPLSSDSEYISELRTAANQKLLKKWYPLAVDKEDGGFYSEILFDFRLGENHQKMIVTQARHIWTNAVAAREYPEDASYLLNARHGFLFLRDHMWDSENGGFVQLVSKQGIAIPGETTDKTAYGNAFAIYGLAAYYASSGDTEALDLAKKTFSWLEEHSHDPVHKGYYQSLEKDGSPVIRTADYPSTSESGYKDQNSSIHLLEALTTLYEVWPDPLVAERLKEMLLLVRDTITTEQGYLQLFFEPDWTPVSFRNADRETIRKHYYMDHVSFGHDVETAYLMLEASHVLGGEEDKKTLETGKKMVDHALINGWDKAKGGFYDGGYYFKGDNRLTIVNDDKNWWSQAEGLNSLLMMSDHFPEDPMAYRKRFETLWKYTKAHLMDPQFGGWYEWGSDVRPETVKGNKGHIWKASYHDYRALLNCRKRLEG